MRNNSGSHIAFYFRVGRGANIKSAILFRLFAFTALRAIRFNIFARPGFMKFKEEVQCIDDSIILKSGFTVFKLLYPDRIGFYVIDDFHFSVY